jgi:hypothetical protein
MFGVRLDEGLGRDVSDADATRFLCHGVACNISCDGNLWVSREVNRPALLIFGEKDFWQKEFVRTPLLRGPLCFVANIMLP